MPRKPSDPKIKKLPTKPKSPADFEFQLSKVVERNGVPISAVSDVYRIAHKGKIKQRPKPVPQPIEIKDKIRSRDAALLEHVRASKNPKLIRPVPIRHAPHEPSAYVLHLKENPLEFSAAEAEEPSDDMEALIPEWGAPYEFPPSLESILLEAQDLVVDEVDPRAFTHQFTAWDPDVAFAARYGWWSRICAPFIRWEVERGTQNAERLTFNVERSTRKDEERQPWYKKIFRKAERAVEEVRDEGEELITQAEEEWEVPVLVPRLHVTRVLAGFLGLLLIISLPAGAVSLSHSFGSSVKQIKSNSQLALADVQTALHASGSDRSAALKQASKRFQAADAALSQVNIVASTLAQALPQTRDLYQSARALLTAGSKATEAGNLLNEGLTRAIDAPSAHPDEHLLTFITYLDSAVPLLEEATNQLQQVHADGLPEEMRPQVATLKDALGNGQASLQEFQAISHLLLSLVGHDRPRTYLFLFQNQTELRPTGGFMGSLAEVDVDRGELKKIRVPGGGPYDLRNQLTTRVVPPQPLQLVASRWEFQDANWFPDFPAAAKKIDWFWSKAGQPTLDGIVTINETIMPKLLAVTGPIDMPEYGKTITADNFLLETQKAVELEYDKTENQPKKFIGDLMPKVLEKIKGSNHDEWLTYLGVLTEALDTKEVQVWAANSDEEGLVERFGWSGQLKPSAGDALALVEANIAGQKTDGVIDERVTHDANIGEDGTIVDTVTIARQHNGQKGELFRGGNNVEYLRLYVPQGSELIEASGFDAPSSSLFKVLLPQDPLDPDVAREVQNERQTVSPDVTATDEFGRTAFGAWVQLAPGASSVTTFKYKLPFTVMDISKRTMSQTDSSVPRAAYTVLLTSQSGKENRLIQSQVHFPSSWTTLWSNRGTTGVPNGMIGYAGDWDQDRVVAALFGMPYAEAPASHP